MMYIKHYDIQYCYIDIQKHTSCFHALTFSLAAFLIFYFWMFVCVLGWPCFLPNERTVLTWSY